MKKNETVEEKIVERLDILIRLSAFSLVGDMPLKDMTIEDKVRFLWDCGLQANDMATVLGRSSGHVRKSLSLMRKKRKAAESRASRKKEE